MNTTVQLESFGLKLMVTFTYYPARAATFYEPPEPEEYDFHGVMVFDGLADEYIECDVLLQSDYFTEDIIEKLSEIRKVSIENYHDCE